MNRDAPETVNDGTVPVILVTGFLGSGKTTLLKRWLSETPSFGRRMGVVMNEFGVSSIDSRLVGLPGLPLVEVNGGCLCCAGDDALPRAVQTLIREGQCDYIVIETSGLADPDNIIDLLTDSDLLPQVTLQSVVTVVDAEWYGVTGASSGERILARRQIQFAQVLCLSKGDRVRSDVLDSVSHDLSVLNPKATQVRLPFGLPDLQVLLTGEPAAMEISPLSDAGSTPESPSHLHAEYRSLSCKLTAPVDRSRFEGFLAEMNPREVVRAKGFVRFTANPLRLHVFQSVMGHHFIEEFPAHPQPEPICVLIGPALQLEAHQQRLRSLLWSGKVVPLIGSANGNDPGNLVLG